MDTIALFDVRIEKLKAEYALLARAKEVCPEAEPDHLLHMLTDSSLFDIGSTSRIYKR